MATTLSPTAYVVLGMLRLGARSGYDIKRAVEVSTRFFWTISQAQIYPTLRQLESSDLIVGRDAPQGRRPRRAYEITADGEAALIEWLGRRESLAFELRDVAMLKLFFADATTSEGASALLAQLRERSEHAVAELRAQAASADVLAEEASARFPAVALEIGIRVHEALIAVTTELEATAGT